MGQIIDRRPNGRNKNAVNRQRFIRRYKEQIKKAVGNIVSSRSISDVDRGEKIVIPQKDINEPAFEHGNGGIDEVVYAGNENFVAGDKLAKQPLNNGTADSEASNNGQGEDDFVFELSRKEFLELYFEGLELPYLVRKDLANINDYKMVRSGITTSGVPTNINIVRTMRQATARRIALATSSRKKLQIIEQELTSLQISPLENKQKIAELELSIMDLRKKIKKVPFIDTIDLRYNNRIKQIVPSTQAVMFCLMDVSGSMDEAKKEIAKRFFILLYLFLTRSYEKIEIVFIRHHTSAKKVDENEFFYSRETGGTVVSSALELMQETIEKHYSPQLWNIYAAQASDGDNWNADSPNCKKILDKSIMSKVQYFSYIEIMPRHHQSLWETYLDIKKSHNNFAMEQVDSVSNIYPVFRKLFAERRLR